MPDEIIIKPQQIEALGRKLYNKFSEYETMRKSKEQEWVEDYRMFKGIYDPEVLGRIDKERSKSYPKIVKPKVEEYERNLDEICFPDIGKGWGISPTPEPEMSDEDVTNIVRALELKMKIEYQQAVEEAKRAGVAPPPPPPAFIPAEEEVINAIKELARKRCKAMEREIEDQFIDIKYTQKMKLAREAGLIFGTGIIKGPLVKYIKEKKWTRDQTNLYVLNKINKPIPQIEFVPIWDFYPDMTTADIDQCDGFFERSVKAKHEIRKMAEREDFAPWRNIILEYLKENPNGDCSLKDWERSLLQTDTKDESSVNFRDKKYEILEYWGYVDARELAEVGVDINEDQQNIELQANVWILGQKVIKAVLNPTPKEELPYSVFYFEKDQTSVFGSGLPRKMRDIQINLCAAFRMMLDNAALAAGPQFEINIDLLDPDSDYASMRAFKIWPREGKNQEAMAPAIRPINIDSHIDEYLKIIDLCLKLSDIETIPFHVLYEAGNREPAQGMSMRTGRITLALKKIAKNFDEFTVKVLEGIYAWNMEFNERKDIKGDYKVEAKGYTSLISKEVRANALENLATTIIPKYDSWIKEYEFLQEIWKALDLPLHMLRTEEEHELFIKESTDPKALQLQIDMVEAKVAELKAKTLSYLAKAKKVNTDAVDIAMGRNK